MPLPAKAQPGHGTMQNQVQTVLEAGIVLAVIDRERPIADDAVQRGPAYRNVKAIAAEELPSEIASHAKAANIAEKLELIPRGKLVTQAKADEGIDPF